MRRRGRSIGSDEAERVPLYQAAASAERKGALTSVGGSSVLASSLVGNGTCLNRQMQPGAMLRSAWGRDVWVPIGQNLQKYKANHTACKLTNLRSARERMTDTSRAARINLDRTLNARKHPSRYRIPPSTDVARHHTPHHPQPTRRRHNEQDGSPPYVPPAPQLTRPTLTSSPAGTFDPALLRAAGKTTPRDTRPRRGRELTRGI